MPVHIGVVVLTLGQHRDVHYRYSTWSVDSKGKLQVHQVFWQLAQEGILQYYQVFLEGKTRHLVSGGEGEGQELRRKGEELNKTMVLEVINGYRKQANKKEGRLKKRKNKFISGYIVNSDVIKTKTISIKVLYALIIYILETVITKMQY